MTQADPLPRNIFHEYLTAPFNLRLDVFHHLPEIFEPHRSVENPYPATLLFEPCGVFVIEHLGQFPDGFGRGIGRTDNKIVVKEHAVLGHHLESEGGIQEIDLAGFKIDHAVTAFIDFLHFESHLSRPLAERGVRYCDDIVPVAVRLPDETEMYLSGE